MPAIWAELGQTAGVEVFHRRLNHPEILFQVYVDVTRVPEDRIEYFRCELAKAGAEFEIIPYRGKPTV